MPASAGVEPVRAAYQRVWEMLKTADSTNRALFLVLD